MDNIKLNQLILRYQNNVYGLEFKKYSKSPSTNIKEFKSFLFQGYNKCIYFFPFSFQCQFFLDASALDSRQIMPPKHRRKIPMPMGEPHPNTTNQFSIFSPPKNSIIYFYFFILSRLDLFSKSFTIKSIPFFKTRQLIFFCHPIDYGQS